MLGASHRDVVLLTEIPWPIDALWDEPRTARALRQLATFSRLIMFDRRGTGGSDPIPTGVAHPVEDDVGDVEVVMNAAGSTAATVIGVGQNGPLAMLYAATRPGSVSGLVLVNAYARLLQDEDYPFGIPPRVRDAFLGASANNRGGVDVYEYLAGSRMQDDAFRAWLSRSVRLAAPPALAHAAFVLSLATDVRAALPMLHLPVLVLHSSENRYVRPDHGRFLAERIPGATFVELPGDGHMLPSIDLTQALEEIEDFVAGTRHTSDVDRVLATVLFTDIVDSTKTAAALGDRRWREVLESHDALAHRHVSRSGGRVVKSTGDGIMATFDGPARAIRCASALQQALRHLSVDTRMGLHAGELEVRDGDIGGIAVHIASRVQAAAQAGEILVTRTVADLVVGSELTFVDHGVHNLKGLPEPWQLLRVLTEPAPGEAATPAP